MSSKLSGRYQQVSSRPSTLTDEVPLLQKQASDGPYQLNCKIEKLKHEISSFIKQLDF